MSSLCLFYNVHDTLFQSNVLTVLMDQYRIPSGLMSRKFTVFLAHVKSYMGAPGWVAFHMVI